MPSSASLESVTLTKTVGISDMNINSLLCSPNHALDHLDLSSTPVSNLTFQALSSPSSNLAIQTLSLSCTPLTLPILSRITSNLSQSLTSLHVSSCHLLDKGSEVREGEERPGRGVKRCPMTS